MIEKYRMNPTQARSTANISGLFILITIFMVSVIVQPFDAAPFSFCIFKNITGFECAGCGLTRAFLFLAHGQLNSAIQQNPLVLPVALLLALQLIRVITLVATTVNYEVNLNKKTRTSLIFISTFAVIATWLLKLVSFQSTTS